MGLGEHDRRRFHDRLCAAENLKGHRLIIPRANGGEEAWEWHSELYLVPPRRRDRFSSKAKASDAVSLVVLLFSSL